MYVPQENLPQSKNLRLRRRLLQIEEKIADEFEAITIQTLIGDIMTD